MDGIHQYTTILMFSSTSRLLNKGRMISSTSIKCTDLEVLETLTMDMVHITIFCKTVWFLRVCQKLRTYEGCSMYFRSRGNKTILRWIWKRHSVAAPFEVAHTQFQVYRFIWYQVIFSETRKSDDSDHIEETWTLYGHEIFHKTIMTLRVK